MLGVLVVFGLMLFGVSVLVLSLAVRLVEGFWRWARPVGFKRDPSHYMIVLPGALAVVAGYVCLFVFPAPQWETYSASPDGTRLVRVEDITASRWDLDGFWWFRVTAYRVPERTEFGQKPDLERTGAVRIVVGHSGFDDMGVGPPHPEDVAFTWQDNATVRLSIDDETMREWLIRMDGDSVTVEDVDAVVPASVSPPTAPTSPPAAAPPPESSSSPRPPASGSGPTGAPRT